MSAPKIEDLLDQPCPHPARSGRHEIYILPARFRETAGPTRPDKDIYCRACGAGHPGTETSQEDDPEDLSESEDWYDQGEVAYAKAGTMDLESKARINAHEVFDELWQGAPEDIRSIMRSRAYAWLAYRMGMTRDECHMKQFNEHQCRRVILLCRRATMETVGIWWANHHEFDSA